MKTITKDPITEALAALEWPATREKIGKAMDCSPRQLARDFAAFNVTPTDFDGVVHLYAEADINRMRAAKREARLARYVNGGGGVKLPAMKHLRAERTATQRKAVRA